MPRAESNKSREERRIMNLIDNEMSRRFPHVVYNGSVEPDEDEMDYVSYAINGVKGKRLA